MLLGGTAAQQLCWALLPLPAIVTMKLCRQFGNSAGTNLTEHKAERGLYFDAAAGPAVLQGRPAR